MKTLRERIQEAMRRNPHLSQADIARACKVKTPSVTGWMNGDTKSLKSETARLGAALFRCDQNWLATGVGTPNWDASSSVTIAAPPSPAPLRTTPTLAAALPIVLDAIAGLTPQQWRMVAARLECLPGQPGDAPAAVLDVLVHFQVASAPPVPRVANG